MIVIYYKLFIYTKYWKLNILEILIIIFCSIHCLSTEIDTHIVQKKNKELFDDMNTHPPTMTLP